MITWVYSKDIYALCEQVLKVPNDEWLITPGRNKINFKETISLPNALKPANESIVEKL